jgi:hypothetical protein
LAELRAEIEAGAPVGDHTTLEGWLNAGVRRQAPA